jgi:uncharacterized protein (TIGR00730 family)
VTDLPFQPPKAYKNSEFLNSPSARHIRILCEYEETRQRFLRYGIRDTLVFFGSARAVPEAVSTERLASARDAVARDPADAAATAALHKAEADQRLSRFYGDAQRLAYLLAEWSEQRGEAERRYTITSGGGPGIMEAANRGASEAGARTAGLGISLPFEQGVNGWVSPELAFEFHYFFTRKYWFLYPCRGLVIFPGGFGTLDELFETLTLVQTGKIKRRLPIVLFGTSYWDRVLDLDVMVEYGTISKKDLDLAHRTDDVDEAFAYLKSALIEAETLHAG